MNQSGMTAFAARQKGSSVLRIVIGCALFTVSLAVITWHASSAWALPPGYGSGPAFCHNHGGGPNPATLHFDNVYACATYSGGYAPGGETPFDENDNESFQCVELSDRFLWARYGLWAGPGSDNGLLNGYNLVSWVGRTDHIPFTKTSPSNIPVAGDIVSFQPGNGYDAGVGHTAVVIASNPTNLQFTILSENWTGTEPGIEIIKIGSGSDTGLTQYSTDGGEFFNGVWDSTNFLKMEDAPTFYIATQSTPTTPANATVGKPYSFTLTTTGANRNLPNRWTLVGGSLPNGLSLSSGGVISGTALTQSTPPSFTVKVVNGAKTSEGTFTIWALNAPEPPLTITTPNTTSSPPNAAVGEPYQFDLQASGGTGTYTWSLVGGALPNGLALSSTGIISGTAPAQSKPPSFTVKTVSGPRTSKKTFTLWALGTATAETTWNLAADFLAHPNENPVPDGYGNTGVWSFLESANLKLGDTYSLLENPTKDFEGSVGTEGWGGSEANGCGTGSVYLPLVVVNIDSKPASGCGTWTVPPHVVDLHPAAAKMAVVAWRSPISGKVTITGGVTSLDPNGGGGISYYIRNGASTLTSGAIADKGSASFPTLSTSVTVGSCLYFLIAPPAAGLGFNSTSLAVTITGPGLKAAQPTTACGSGSPIGGSGPR